MFEIPSYIWVGEVENCVWLGLMCETYQKYPKLMWYTRTPGAVYGSSPLVFVLAFPEEFGSVMSTDELTYESKFGSAIKKTPRL
jgi:hypothetical protein